MVDPKKLAKIVKIRKAERDRLASQVAKLQLELQNVERFVVQLEKYAHDYSSNRNTIASQGVTSDSLQALDSFGARLRATVDVQKSSTGAINARLAQQKKLLFLAAEKLRGFEKVLEDAQRDETRLADRREALEYLDQVK
jgi:flagellar export protein FliJ